MKAFGVMMFFIVFFIVMLVTSALPDFPPGKQVAGFLGIDLVAIPTSGIPTATLLVGFLNGLVYGVAALLAFAAASWMPTVLNRG